MLISVLLLIISAKMNLSNSFVLSLYLTFTGVGNGVQIKSKAAYYGGTT